MKRLGFAPEAVADLRDIALYIADESPQRALSFVGELEQRAMEAASHPLAFRDWPEISLVCAQSAMAVILFSFANWPTKPGLCASFTARETCLGCSPPS